MEFILNDESLCGQFDSIGIFLDSLKENVRCFELINNVKENKIYKTERFYENKATSIDKLCDLNKYNNNTDELFLYLIQLDSIIYEDPYWDNNFKQNLAEQYMCDNRNVSCTCVAEAAENNIPLLSFRHEKFIDKELEVFKGAKKIKVYSIYTPQYLSEKFYKELKLSRLDLLKTQFNNTRIDCSILKPDCGVDELEDKEFDLLIGTLKKFVNHESWETIAIDDGLQYKKYHNKDNDNPFWSYKGKTIMKFRFSKVMRVFGYRKGERFRIIRFERDHDLSDKG